MARPKSDAQAAAHDSDCSNRGGGREEGENKGKVTDTGASLSSACERAMVELGKDGSPEVDRPGVPSFLLKQMRRKPIGLALAKVFVVHQREGVGDIRVRSEGERDKRALA